jgi:type VI secretion system secreted protein Hcp
MFLKADPIKGEALDQAHAGQIEVLSYNTGVTQAGGAVMGSGAGAGKVQVQPFAITKAVDASSPQFFLYSCNGKHIPTVVLELTKQGDTPQAFLRYTLGDVIVSSVQMSGKGETDRPTEEISFNFAKINIEYMGSNAKGAGVRSEAGWDLKMNKAASAGGSGGGGGTAPGMADGSVTPAPDAGAAPAGAAVTGAGAITGGVAPAPASATPAAGDATSAAGKPLTRAQRDRMKVQQPAPAK